MGPEALLVSSRIASRAGLTEYAGLDYARSNVLCVEAAVRANRELLSGRPSAARGLLRWGRKWFRRVDARGSPIAATLAARPKAVETSTRNLGPARGTPQAPLAALPALQAGVRPEGEPRSISEVLILRRA
jgi:hypothetical protein